MNYTNYLVYRHEPLYPIIINSRIDGININNISIRILQLVGLKSVPFKQRRIV